MSTLNPSPRGGLPQAAPGNTALPRESPRILTVAEAAGELRCSKAHVHHLITGKVPGVRPLPSLWLGRRRLILRASLEEWIRATEQT